MPAIETLTALRQAADGLTYTSETDAPWAAFAWPSAGGPPTADGVRRRGRHKSGAPTAEQSVDDFFRPLTEPKDWHGDEDKERVRRYAALRGVVTVRLSSPTVVKVGEVEVTVYVVGVAPEGGWAGVRAKAVET